jgi:saccharopine dehydrogenase-like NADP-dependent oxidoreductase
LWKFHNILKDTIILLKHFANMVNPTDFKPVVFIGAAGEMCRIAVERFAKASNTQLILADLNTAVIESLAAKLPPGQATTQKLDLFDDAALASLISGARLVVLGAGPYSKTSHPVVKACIKAQVPYLDFDDDVESTQAALALTEETRKAGVPIYIGCGASPGMSNVMALDAASELDSVDSIDLCWLVGDEASIGKAVLHHLMHIAAGPCLTWVDSKPTVKESWVGTTYAPMYNDDGERLLHETAHPEPVTVPRAFPKATRIQCFGSLDPKPLNGIARGLGSAVRAKALSMDEAIEFLYNMATNPPLKGGLGALQEQFRGGDITLKELYCLINHVVGPLRYALWGMIEQIWNGECTIAEVVTYITIVATGTKVENRGNLLVRATGMRSGVPTVITKRNPKNGKDSYLCQSMGTMTGTPTAAFMLMALEDGHKRSGVFCPEDWARPEVFYSALERVGVPKDEIVESI